MPGRSRTTDRPRRKRSRCATEPATRAGPCLTGHPVRIRGGQVEPVEFLHRGDAFQRFGRERRLALEAVQHDALEQVAEGHVLVLGQRLEHLEHPLLDADAGLDAFGPDLAIGAHATAVPSKPNALATGASQAWIWDASNVSRARMPSCESAVTRYCTSTRVPPFCLPQRTVIQRCWWSGEVARYSATCRCGSCRNTVQISRRPSRSRKNTLPWSSDSSAGWTGSGSQPSTQSFSAIGSNSANTRLMGAWTTNWWRAAACDRVIAGSGGVKYVLMYFDTFRESISGILSPLSQRASHAPDDADHVPAVVRFRPGPCRRTGPAPGQGLYDSGLLAPAGSAGPHRRPHLAHRHRRAERTADPHR